MTPPTPDPLPPTPADPAAPLDSPSSESHIIADRRVKLARLRDDFRLDPYGSATPGLIPLAQAAALLDPAADAAHKADAAAPDSRPVAAVSGRIVLHRDIGKLIFMTLRDDTADLQVAVSKKAVPDGPFQLAKLADLGDIVVARGPIGTTKTGETTLWAAGDAAFTVASKSLAPPPDKHKGLRDPELRYRRRYVDLYARPEVMRTMRLRSRIIQEVRSFLLDRGFLEVETPMMQPIPGGAAARPFITHHNALDADLYLRIAPELYLKRLLVGGMRRVFEINRNFRNEGIDRSHNPEFTMLELYEAFGSWQTMADLVEQMIQHAARTVIGSLVIQHTDDDANPTHSVDLTGPWPRIPMADLVEKHTGWRFDKQPLQNSPDTLGRILDAQHEKHSLELDQRRARLGEPTARPYEQADKWRAFVEHNLTSMTPAEQLVYLYELVVEPTLINPTFVTQIPSVIIPLAKENPADPYFADVYELAINGMEISPGYSELNDPDAQERHFRHQVGDATEQQAIDHDFLEALRVGMPPAGGLGLGIDRLVMLLTNQRSIRDVILFPLLRPQT